MVVEILGRSLKLKSSLPAERLKLVAQEVDHRLRQVQQAFPTATVTEVAILTALNLACDIMESREDYQRLRVDIQERSSQLLHKLEVHNL